MSKNKLEKPINETPVAEKSKSTIFDPIIAFINQIPAVITATSGPVKLLIGILLLATLVIPIIMYLTPSDSKYYSWFPITLLGFYGISIVATIFEIWSQDSSIPIEDRDWKRDIFLQQPCLPFLLQNMKHTSSVLLELGIALEKKVSIVIATNDRDELPFLVSKLDSEYKTVNILTYSSNDYLFNQLKAGHFNLFKK